MRVLLLQLDGKLPNLALMRLAAHHRAHGDEVTLRRAANSASLQPRFEDEPWQRVYGSLIFDPLAGLRAARGRASGVCGRHGDGAASTLRGGGVMGGKYKRKDTFRSLSQILLRNTEMRDMAAKGHTSRQIATAVGLTVEGCRNALRRENIPVPADKSLNRAHLLNSTRVMEHVVMDAENLTADCGLIEFGDLDPRRYAEWLNSLKASREKLGEFIRRLMKEQSDYAEAKAHHGSNGGDPHPPASRVDAPALEDPARLDSVDAGSAGPGDAARVPEAPRGQVGGGIGPEQVGVPDHQSQG